MCERFAYELEYETRLCTQVLVVINLYSDDVQIFTQEMKLLANYCARDFYTI